MKKLPPAEFEKIIEPLPTRQRIELRETDLTPALLDAAIVRCKKLMQRDVWVGLPWFIAYSISIFTRGFDNLTVGIFVIGMVYFVYTIFTTGSFGMNRKKVRVYEELLEKMK